MSEEEPHFAELAALDRLVHDPSRLAILSALLGWTEAEFSYLLTATGLTKGNLSSHLGKLEAGGLIEIGKGYKGKTPWTRAKLTKEGRDRVEAHWAELDRIRRETMSYKS
ncbi:MAG: transcriptional regulator [Allosphingosinicella sp.]